MKTLVITFLIGGALAILVLGLQRKELVTLEDRAEELRREIEETSVEPSHARQPAVSQPGLSQVDLPEIHASIEELISSMELVERNPRGFVAILPSVLEIVADCNGDDLSKLADLMSEPGAGGEGGEMFSMVLKILAVEQNPKKFVQELMESDGDGFEEEMRSVAIAAWARQDPQSVLAWILEQGPNAIRKVDSETFGSIGAELMKSDVESAVEFFHAIDPRRLREALHVMSLMRDSDPHRLLDTAGEVEKREVRRELQNAGLGSIFTREGIEAGMAAAEAIEDIGDREKAIAYASGQSAAVRPVETMNWLMGLEGDRQQAIHSAILTWTNSDFRAVANWLGEQEPSAKNDLAIQSFAGAILHFEPESALDWAGTISDQAMRDKVMQEHYRKWEALDEKAARQWKESQREQ